MKSLKILFLLGASLLLPSRGHAQAGSSTLTLQATGLFSEFRYERGPEAWWRASSTIRLKVLLRDRVFGELSYTAPISSEEHLLCPLWGSCGQPLTALHFSALSGGLGIRFQFGGWNPFISVGGGRFKTVDESHWTWMGSTGLERSLNHWLGLSLEYRLSRVNWPYEGGVSLNHEVGIGLSLALHPV